MAMGTVLAILGTGGADAQAAQVSFIHGQTTTSNQSVAAGESVRALGRGFPAGMGGPIRIGSGAGSQIGQYSAGSDGTFDTTVVIPASQPPGQTSLIACTVNRDGSCAQQSATTVVVTARATTTTTRATTTTTARATTTTTAVRSTTTVTNPGDIGAVTTTTNIDGLAVTSTTVEGSPPAPDDPDAIAVPTTKSTFDLKADIPEEIPNLAINDVEVTQGLQNLANTFPLVRNRRTAVRIHGLVTEEGESQGGVTGVIRVYRLSDGNETLLGQLFDDNPGAVIFEDHPRRLSNLHTPHFELPVAWAKGTIKVKAWVFAYDVKAENEPDQSDNYFEVTVEFDPGRAIHVYYWPLYLTENNDPDGAQLTVDPFDEWIPEQVHVYRELPIPTIFGHPQSAIVGDADSDWDLSEDSPDMGAPLAALLEMHSLDGRADNDHYVGLVHPDVPSKFGGLAKGKNKPVLWVKWRSGFDSVFPWRHQGGSILAHELGHNMGIKHAPCKFEIGDPYPGEIEGGAVDPSFPGLYGFPTCSLAPQENDGYMGWDVGWALTPADEPPVISNVPYGDKEPNFAFPFMGYKSPGWVDPWHGCMVLKFVEVACDQLALGVKDLDAPSGGGDPGGIPTPGQAVPKFNCTDFGLGGKGETDLCNLTFAPGGDPTENQSHESDGFLLISGTVNRKTGVGVVEQALSVPDPKSIDPVLGDEGEEVEFLLALETADGVAALRTVRIETEGGGHAGSGDGTEWFTVTAPPVHGLTKVSLLGKGTTLAELTPKGSGPTGGIGAVDVDADLQVPLSLSDPEGGPVNGYLQYRPSADASWQTIAGRVSSDVALASIQSLPASDAGELRLLATDGWTTSQSRATDIVVPEKGAVVTIISPRDGSTRTAGHPLDLEAQALDAEDGFLDGGAVVWSSDVDGEIGNGAALSTSELSEGAHVLTVKATDSMGIVTVASVAVTIGPSDLPDDDVLATLAEVVFSSDRDSTGSSRGLPIVPGALILGALVGLGAYVRARSGRSTTPD